MVYFLTCQCRATVDWLRTLLKTDPFQVSVTGSQDYLQIIEVRIYIKKKFTVSNVGELVEHLANLFARIIEHGISSHPLN